jgi:predicted membrane protein
MKINLANKQGILAIAVILLLIIGIVIMVYPFAYYQSINSPNMMHHTMLLYVLGTKSSGVGFLYIGSELYHRHFKRK